MLLVLNDDQGVFIKFNFYLKLTVFVIMFNSNSYCLQFVKQLIYFYFKICMIVLVLQQSVQLKLSAGLQYA